MTREDIELRRQRVLELTNEGKTARDISIILNITERTVTRARKATGCSQQWRPPLTTQELAIAKQLLDDGCPYTEVARTLGRSATAIQKRLPGKGLTPHETGLYNWARKRLELL